RALPGRDRTDTDQVLLDYHVGAVATQQVGGEDVQLPLLTDLLTDRFNDLARGLDPSLRERAPRDDRLRDGVGRVIAFVGHADEVVAQPERVDDLGRRREQGRDLHRGKSRTARSDSNRSMSVVRPPPAASP